MLGFIGFSALGPIAGSIAAGWQSSLGAYVGAGSLFAWCQSAAMGGAAANTVFATLVAGASAGAAWGAGSTVLLKNLNKKPEELLEIFGRVYRKVES